MAMWLLVLPAMLFARAGNILGDLKKMPQVKEITKLEKRDTTRTYYLLKFQQLVDPKNPAAGTFTQRVMLGHRGYDRPTVIVTEGYGGDYAFNNPGFAEELSTLLDANILFCEYRYFLESTPNPCNWDYLTVENATYDYHAIRQAFGKLYGGKWLSTGISKGGQTTIFYRTFFPQDVDISVPYVAPLNIGIEDGRHESFIEQIATSRERDAVRNFQILALERKPLLLPRFIQYCKDKGYTFRIPVNEIYDFSVLEFSFAFWQWGMDIEGIPASTATDEQVFDYFIKVLEPDYFSEQSPYLSFNVQTIKEMGYYGYNMEPFRKWMDIKTTEGYFRKIMLPEELSHFPFDQTLYRKTVDFLTDNDVPMIFIYGQWDPWTATGATWLQSRDKKQMQVYVCPNGSHRSRINDMPAPVKEKIMNQLQEWLKK